MRISRRDQSRGVALVSVLLIVVIVTVLAFEIADRHAFSVAISRQTLDGSQARHYALGGELYARLLLQEDWLDENTRIKDTLEDIWAMPEESFEVEDGSIEMRIVDLNSRFNLNAVIGGQAAPNVRHFNRLLTHLGFDPAVADAWRDWIDADEDVTGAGAEDADYLLHEPPRVAANQPARHVSEFLVPVPLEPEEFAPASATGHRAADVCVEDQRQYRKRCRSGDRGAELSTGRSGALCQRTTGFRPCRGCCRTARTVGGERFRAVGHQRVLPRSGTCQPARIPRGIDVLAASRCRER